MSQQLLFELDISAAHQQTPEPFDGLLEAGEFAAEIARMLRPLRAMHLRVSLYSLRFRGQPGRLACNWAGGALRRYGPVGALPDGRIGMLYVGPKVPGDDSGDELSDLLSTRVRDVLLARGIRLRSGAVQLMVTHRWSDEITDPGELLVASTPRDLGAH